MKEKNYDETGGFSIVRIVLSDALPAKCFHPDFAAQPYEASRKKEEERHSDEQQGEQGRSSRPT